MNRKHAFFLFLKLFVVSVFLCWSVPSQALKEATSSKLIEYLAVEKVNLTVSNSNLRSFSAPVTQANYLEKKAWIEKQQQLIIAKIETLNAFLSNQEKKHHELKSRLKQFKQSSLIASEGLMLQESMQQVQALMEANDKAIALIGANLTLAYQYQKALYQHDRELILWKAKEDKKQKITAKKAEIARLEETRTNLYEKNIVLEQQKKSDLHSDMRGLHDESTLFLNNQWILFVDYQMRLVRLEMKLIEAEYTFLNQPQDLRSLESILAVYEEADDVLETFLKACTDMKKALDDETIILSSAEDKKALLALQKRINTLIEKVNQLKAATKKTAEEKQVILKKQRVSRQSLEDYQQVSWAELSHQFLQIPVQFYQYLQALFSKTFDYYLWEDTGPQVLFWVMVLFVSTLFWVVRRLLREVTQEKTRSRFSGHLYDGALLLLYRNLPQFLLVSLLVVSFVFNQVLFVQYKLLFHLLVIWLVFRQFKGIARLALLERVSDVPQHEMTLYRRFKWLFFMGAWATGLMILGQELPLSFLLQDVFNRLFMLFLLAIAWVLWKSRDILPELFYLWLHANKRPFRHLLGFLSVLIPLSLLTTALIGLFGYIHFAWILAGYQAYFLLVLTAYVLLRELLSDFLDLISEKMVSKLHNGWLWVEAILKPLEKWLHFGLFLLSIVVILSVFKNNLEAPLYASLYTIGHYDLFSGSEVHITLFSMFEATIVLLVLIWLSKWTREFCYRWLYRRIIDAAIRNSMSVFTQYAVIVLGACLFLRVLGVDLTGMGIVLGGLAVGMGFGLRDFASNIIGGMMLFIERPVREGDLITLGEYEGRVAHIGIRSIRVSSWDQMDVIIPNAETFNKPVTNWTHQDAIVRTVLPIKVSREDDPNLVRQLIFDVLDIIPEVLKEPPYQVFLKHIDDALIAFEVRYFINIQLNTRVAVRSDVLLAIMAQFKAAGIQAPIPPFRIEVDKVDKDESKPSSKD